MVRVDRGRCLDYGETLSGANSCCRTASESPPDPGRPGSHRVMPGELHALLEDCRAEDALAWERFAAWVKTRGRAVLSAVDKLSNADGEDAVADALTSLVTVVRRGDIGGASNAEID